MRVTRYLPTTARLLLGLIFTVFGLNFFFHFLPMPPPTGRAAAFLAALAASGYLLQLVHATEVIAGVLLLANRRLPLALALLAPIVVNIVGFHLFLDPRGLAIPIAILAGELYLAWTQRAAFGPMLRRDAGRSKMTGPHATARVSKAA